VLFDGRGRSVEERQFEDGALRLRRVLHYGPSGVSRIEVFDGQGRLLHEDHFLLSAGGELLRVLRQGPEGERQELALAGRAGRIYEERHAAAGQVWINRYDEAGRVVGRETWEAGKPVQRQWLEYGEQGLRSVRTGDLASGRETLESYDAQGRLAVILVEERGRRIRETRLLRDGEGRLASKESRGEDGLEQWSYAYGAEGSLERESYSRRGSVRSVTAYGAEGARVEELYRDGEVVLRVHYLGQRKQREETVEGGQIVRVKEFP